jgi:drug/metabolite transporter (DMT)-like permease
MSGLASAILFGISAPLAKLLLPRIDPWVLAGLLYLGAGVGLTLLRAVRGIVGANPIDTRSRLRRRDWPLLITIAAVGGGAGPLLLLTGLGHVSGVAGSLLLNLEAVFTMVLAVTVFGERLTRREFFAAAIVLLGAVVLGLRRETVAAELVGVAAIAAACLAWGLDNNLTARLSQRNPLGLVQFKTLSAGAGNLGLALLSGRSLPLMQGLAAALVVGFVCYGLSIVLDVYALRYVGAARESAFFATAPFAGALAAVPLLGEPVTLGEVTGGAIMAVGVILMVAGRMGAQTPPRPAP